MVGNGWNKKIEKNFMVSFGFQNLEICSKILTIELFFYLIIEVCY